MESSQNNKQMCIRDRINGIQFAVPASALKTIKLSPPETNQEFWQQTYLKQHLYEYFGERGYKSKLRKEVDEECRDYLYKLEEIGYEDDFITSYVQNIFAKLTATGIDPNRSEPVSYTHLLGTAMAGYRHYVRGDVPYHYAQRNLYGKHAGSQQYPRDTQRRHHNGVLCGSGRYGGSLSHHS